MSKTTAAWEPAERSKVREYYRNEFPEYIERIPSWISPDGPKEIALAFGNGFPVISEDQPNRDFIRRSTRDANGVPKFDTWDDLLSFINNPARSDPLPKEEENSLADPQVTEEPAPVPEAVYYGLNHHNRFWVLAFDIDAKDVAKQRISRPEQTHTEVSEDQIKAANVHEKPPTPVAMPPTEGGESSGGIHSYAYTFEDLSTTVSQGFELKEWLEESVGFDQARIFYSGQGVHVYALLTEPDPYYEFTQQSRRFLTTYIQEKLGIPVDAQVTWDKKRVMRMPYSLHAGVSRIVTEIPARDFDFRSEPVPQFHTLASSGGD